jgi:hypothetical protein
VAEFLPAPGSGGGGPPPPPDVDTFELIETIETAVNEQIMLFTPLVGDTDGNYLLIGDVIGGPGGADILELSAGLGGHPNTLDLVTSAALGGWKIGDISSGLSYHFRAEFNAKTGVMRQGWCRITNYVFGSGISRQDFAWGNEDSATPITAIGLFTSGIHGIGAGSRVSLYRIKVA